MSINYKLLDKISYKIIERLVKGKITICGIDIYNLSAEEIDNILAHYGIKTKYFDTHYNTSKINLSRY